jgi:hypothetical protein
MSAQSIIYIIPFLIMLFLVWWRRTPGRHSIQSPEENSDQDKIKDMKAFDQANPDASLKQRKHFYEGVQAQIDGKNSAAQTSYKDVLADIPGEPITTHNLRIIKSGDADS